MSFIANVLIGLLFGVGLIVSGMGDPAKVQNFLDLFGTWDPSLALVMGGAVTATFLGYRLVLRRHKPIAAPAFQLPRNKSLDAKIVIGPLIFGIGWGLGGYCPGPSLTAATLGAAGTWAFLPMMFLGMWLARMVSRV